MKARAAPVDFADVQGIVRFGYKRLPEACYLLLRIKRADAARAWIRGLPIANAVESASPPQTALQIAFTAAGLRALGVAADVVGEFSAEFLSGLAGSDARSRRLGDVGPSSPGCWEWGTGEREPHVLLMLFAMPGSLDELVERVVGASWDEGVERLERLDTSDLNGVEPFGFADGISQPSIDWERRRTAPGSESGYSNLVALGEFLLGYPNEYGNYTERPLLAPDADPSASLAPAEDDPARRDLAKNGTYVVLRDLRQDVRGFWQCMFRKPEGAAPAGEALAAAVVGRTRAGESLAVAQAVETNGIVPTGQHAMQNAFTYDGDPDGLACPLGAHVRRVNPRNGDFPTPPRNVVSKLLQMLGFRRAAFQDDLLSSVRFHRLLRRGREYGPGLSPLEALDPPVPGEAPRGLRFLALNANISRQFEFLQNAWLMNPKFNGLPDVSDPLVGARRALDGTPSDAFVVERQDRMRSRAVGLPQFVRVVGGAYFFLPSLRALRYFTATGAEGAA